MKKNRAFTKGTLRANYFYNFASQVLTLIIPLLTTPYLARVFHEEGNGQIAFANTIITYFTMFANLGFSTYGQREIAKYQDDDYNRTKVFWEVFLLRAIFTLISLILLVISTSVGIYGQKYNTLIFLFSIQVFAVLFDVNFFFQGQEDFKSIAIRTITLKLVCLACVFLFVRKSTDTWIYALMYSLSVLIANALMWPRLITRIIKIPYNNFDLRKHLKPSLIIFFPTLAATIYGSLDKLMIGYLCGNPDYENGCYNQALKLNQAMLVVVIVLNSIMIARNSHDYAVGNRTKVKEHINFSCNYVISLGIPMIAGVVALSENLSSWYLGSGYKEVPILLNIMSTRFITSGLACVFGNELFISIGKEKYPTIAHIITAVTNLILNVYFISHWGAVGGAITTALSEFTDFAVLFWLACREGYVKPKSLLIMSLKPLVASVVMFMTVKWIDVTMRTSFFSFAICVCAGTTIYACCLLLFKDTFANTIFAKYAKPYLLVIKRKAATIRKK